ncbi:NAD(P)/FAD-dependent oxidoreductase [Kribbella sp. CA-293567]|uniref:NAD(P)/FAD-dependent oxidoreductase n=1 Tax=Kribbella sp. CA-293567 TaxID=3002436 RepID=UPI0022DE3AE4|nr:FAD-dependent oxidoreductase [Kribbella sp. CA-293567]WBQ02816.1 FAD-dependent oxidoreductase [Kribbella sp. CA-293567]
MTGDRPTAAVLGSGVSGLTAAHLLQRTHDVTVFEADDRPGGHAHTHDVTDSAGGALRIDTGFIVHNERTYPNLLRLFAELGIRTQPTEMSMSVHCDGCGLEYAGGRGARALFSQPRRAGDPRFLRMLAEVPRFHREARAVLVSGDDQQTWGEFLRANRFSQYFVRHFAVPLVSCVWSSGSADAERYPARYLFQFLDHHGMLTVSGSPKWRTVTGGSRTYVDAVLAQIAEVRLSTPVRAVLRHDDSVEVITDRSEHFDKVVVATHADTALALLGDATPEEKTLLGAFSYSTNPTWLHTDTAVLPKATAARSSWNYRMRGCDTPEPQVLVSYWMDRLQHLQSPDEHLVTLNPDGWVDPAKTIAQMTYAHPIFTPESVAAAPVLRTAGGPRLAFAGAHLGWGFHEDGCRSGVEAAERLGAKW